MGLRLRLRPRLARLSGSCWKRRKALRGRARQEVRKEANLLKVLLEMCEDTIGWRCLRLDDRGILLRLLLRPRLRLLLRLRLAVLGAARCLPPAMACGEKLNSDWQARQGSWSHASAGLLGRYADAAVHGRPADAQGLQRLRTVLVVQGLEILRAVQIEQGLQIRRAA